MTSSLFLTRVSLRNYKSIASCDVKLSSLTFLVGANGAGKSNFMDAIRFVKDALHGTLDNAINERGGLSEVRRRSSDHPTHFGIRLEFRLQSGESGYYAFTIGDLPSGGYEVQREECSIGGLGRGPYFCLEHGKLLKSSETIFPTVTADRLALVSASGLTVFRPVFDALTGMGFYNLNLKTIRELQKPQDGRLLKSSGENIASVIGHLERTNREALQIIEDYLHAVVPMVHGVERQVVGPMESLSFQQDMAGAKHPWRFFAQSMSDGTLRALGILTALFQGNSDHSLSLIAIEEPETALHPGASGALREALVRASERTQVLVTSHSPELLDDMKIPADALLVVASEEGATQITPVDSAAREAIRTHLCSAGELLRLNQLNVEQLPLEYQVSRQSDLFGPATP